MIVYQIKNKVKAKSGKNNHNYKHGNRIGQSKYHNLDGSLKERVAS